MVVRTYTKEQTLSNEGQGSRRDYLTATTPEGKIELTEKELSGATGGTQGSVRLYEALHNGTHIAKVIIEL